MDKNTKQFIQEVRQYFLAMNAYLQTGNKEHNTIMIQLQPRLQKNAAKLLANEQHKPHAEQDHTPTLSDLLDHRELVDILFTDTKSRQRYLSRSPQKLIQRCDHLNMPHNIILKLERAGQIRKIPNVDHYERT